MNRKIRLSTVCLMALTATAIAAPRELFRPASKETVEAFRHLAVVMASDDGGGVVMSESYRRLRPFAELDFERGTADRVLGSLSLSPELVARVAELREVSDPRDLREKLDRLAPMLLDVRKLSYKGSAAGTGVKDRVAQWVRAYAPRDEEVELGGGFSPSLMQRAEQLNALRSFYGLDIQLSYIQFMAQAHLIRRMKEKELLEHAASGAEGVLPAGDETAPSSMQDAAAGAEPRRAFTGLRPATKESGIGQPPASVAAAVPAGIPLSPFSTETIEGEPGLLKALPSGEALFLSLATNGNRAVRLRIFDGDQIRRDVLLDGDRIWHDRALRKEAAGLLGELRGSPAGATSKAISDELAKALRDSSAAHSLIPPALLLLAMAIFFAWLAMSSQSWVDSINAEILRDLRDAINN